MKIISKETVKPNEPTWNGILPLTILDHISVITRSSAIYFYEKPKSNNSQNPSNNETLNTLKLSLSRVLVPFYPLAGRLSWIEVEGGRPRLMLQCNGMGVEFIEAESSMKITDFGNFYSSSETFQHLVPHMDYFGTPIENIPLLAVQITRFTCGGLSVGISVSHVVVDGRSAFHFIDEWARLTRGEPLQKAPFLDRKILQLEDMDVSLAIKGENDKYFYTLESGKQLTPTFVVLTKDKIDLLKKVANEKNNEQRSFSRFEVITAHIWRCVCKARNLKSDDISSFFVLVDARGRMDPPLPSSYFGNAIIDIKSSICAGDLISKPLSYACSKIRDASTKVTNDYVLEFIGFLKKEESLTKYQYIDDCGKLQGPSYGDHNLVAISWLNLMDRDVDFGWGKEIYKGPPLVYGCDGDIMIIPYNNDGSVLVAVFLEPKQKFQEYIMSLPIV